MAVCFCLGAVRNMLYKCKELENVSMVFQGFRQAYVSMVYTLQL
jgi:hypothetical protein